MSRFEAAQGCQHERERRRAMGTREGGEVAPKRALQFPGKEFKGVRPHPRGFDWASGLARFTDASVVFNNDIALTLIIMC